MVPRRASGKGGRRRERPGAAQSRGACSVPERRADAAAAEVCSVASWRGEIPLDRRPAPAENHVTRWFSALCRTEGRNGDGGWGCRERRFRQLGLCTAYAPVTT